MKFEKKKEWFSNMMLTRQGQVLVNNGLRSVSNNQWLTIDNKEFFFKEENIKRNNSSVLGELLYHYMAKKLDMNALEVKPAHVFSYLSHENYIDEVSGVMSQNFIVDKKNQEFMDFYKVGASSSTDVDSNTESLKELIKSYEEKNIKVICDTEKIKWQLKQVCILDYFLALWDRHNGNLGLITTKKNEQIEIEFSPIFDNAMIFFLSFKGLSNQMTDLYAKKSFSKLNDLIDENFSSCFFLKQNSLRFAIQNLPIDIAREIIEDKETAKFYNKIKQINLKEIAREIEKNNPGYEVPKDTIGVGQFIINHQIKKIENNMKYLKTPTLRYQSHAFLK